jgi:chromosome segregation ATPase
VSKQDRQGVRNASDLERKYQFGKQFAEIMGVALDAQKSVSEVESTLSDKILEQYSSFTRTTDEIKMEVGELSESNETIKGNVATLEVRSDEISTEVAQVTETTETLKTETGELKGQTETLIEEVGVLKVSYDGISTEVSNVKTTTETLQQDAEDTDAELEEIRETITKQNTSILQSADQIILTALQSYVTTSDYEEFKKVLASDFEVWAE